jgi:hypothetical protein
MTGKLHHTVTLLFLMALVTATAQETSQTSQQGEKILGSRFTPYPNYPGSPFLNDKFLLGEIEFTDGSRIANIGLNYGSYRDELIYYNSTISTQIVIDIASLNGFTFRDSKGKKRVFRRLYFTGSFKGNCYFEVLSEGKYSVLAYRKVNLEASDAYYSKTGMAYQPAYSYYLNEKNRGFSPVKLNRKSLLTKFGKADQKVIKKTLRKNGVTIFDEESFIRAWELIAEKGMIPTF